MKSSILSICMIVPSLSIALETLPDETLSTMTGQAGITIDIETQITLDQFRWIDTDTGGSVNLNNIRVGGWNVNDTLDDLRLVIDSNASGDLQIDVVNQSQHNTDGSYKTPMWFSNAPDPIFVDMGIDISSFGIEGTAGTSTIASNIRFDISLGPQRFIIKNDGDTGLISAKGLFQVTGDSGFDLDIMGTSISNLKIGNFSGSITADDNAFLIAGPPGTIVTTRTDAGQLFNDPRGEGLAYYDLSIGTTATDQLVMDINNFNADIHMDVAIGNAPIGQMGITDLDISGTQLIVYGH